MSRHKHVYVCTHLWHILAPDFRVYGDLRAQRMHWTVVQSAAHSTYQTELQALLEGRFLTVCICLSSRFGTRWCWSVLPEVLGFF